MPYQKIPNLELSESAKQDLRDIAQYTYTNYGKVQMKKNLELIDRKFSFIAENPDIGHFRDDLPEKCNAFSRKKNILSYSKQPFINVQTS